MTVKYFRDGLDAILHPWETTKKSMDVGEAYMFYYKATVVPLVVYILLSLLLFGVAAPALSAYPFLSNFVGFGWAGAIIIPIVVLWILVPILIFIQAAVLHIVGAFITKQFKQGFDKTLNASMYSKLPSALFGYLWAVPLAVPLLLIFGIWDFIVSLIALANQQKMRWTTSLGIVIISAVLLILLIDIFVNIFVYASGISMLTLIERSLWFGPQAGVINATPWGIAWGMFR